MLLSIIACARFRSYFIKFINSFLSHSQACYTSDHSNVCMFCLSCKMWRFALYACIFNLIEWFCVTCMFLFLFATQCCDEWCILGSISGAVYTSSLVSDCCWVIPGVHHWVMGTQVTNHQSSLTTNNNCSRFSQPCPFMHHVKISLGYVPKSQIIYILKVFIVSTVRLLFSMPALIHTHTKIL